MIKHGGYSVYALEVEQVLEQHPDVLEASVVGLPDERLGEVPAAVVRLRGGRDPRRRPTSSAWADERLADYKVPEALRGRRRASPAPARSRSRRRSSLALFD